MKIFVTGSSGLFGAEYCRLAMKSGHTIYASYNRDTPSTGTSIKYDITDTPLLKKNIESIKPDVLVHAAAITSVDACEQEQALAIKVNAEATAHIATICKRLGIFMIYLSTDYVFDGVKGSYVETDPPHPINHYGYTKLKGEEAVQDTLEAFCIARTSVLYGANPAAGKTNFALWLLTNLRGQQPVKIVTDQWNSPTLNISLAAMIDEIANRRLKGVYHLSGATRISRVEYARKLAQEFQLSEQLIIPVSSSELVWGAERPRDSSLQVGKANKILTNKPLDITDSLKRLHYAIEKNI